MSVPKRFSCKSHVGLVRGEVNLVLLESSPETNCLWPEIIVHELLHLLGLFHEHTRSDADQYIRVHYENIDPARYVNFQPEPSLNSHTSTYGIPYDYRSVMHYGKSYFAANPTGEDA